MKNDKQSRKWQLTINNYIEKGFGQEQVKVILIMLKSITYFCMSEEVGQEGTPHIHIFLMTLAPIRFSTLKARFPEAHIEQARGTAEQNRDYIFKTGKWADDEKHGTKVEGTQEEYGELPVERQGERVDLALLYQQIADGRTNAEIIRDNPDYILNIERLDRVRQTIREEAYRGIFRMLEVTYIWGDTNTGKTRSVMEEFGYGEVFRVTNYDRGSFDLYRGQEVIVFEEFRGSFKIQDMLNYLDGYPLLLPARYFDRVACYTKVYIISNIDLMEQYRNVQYEHFGTWQAFLRRIHRVLRYYAPSQYEKYEASEYVRAAWTRQPVVAEWEPEDVPTQQLQGEQQKFAPSASKEGDDNV